MSPNTWCNLYFDPKIKIELTNKINKGMRYGGILILISQCFFMCPTLPYIPQIGGWTFDFN